jgi:phage terminase large subunit-like protein
VGSSDWRVPQKPPRFPRGTGILHVLLDAPPDVREAMVRALGPEDADALDGDFESWAHEGQFPPDRREDGADWSTCVVMGGRGFGKTFAGAKWIESQVAASSSPLPLASSKSVLPPAEPERSGGSFPSNWVGRGGAARLRIALVGATLAEARRVMVEGPSGLLEVAGHCIREWRPSHGLLRFRGGAEAQLFSGHSPELLRGPQHHLAWCDELAKWEKAQETWDMLQLGLRLGEDPRAIVTTTPRPGPVLRAIMADPATVVIGGPTRANPHNGERWNAKMTRLYAGTRLGRQELGGELLSDAPGQLWTVELLERCRDRSAAAPNPVRAEPVEAPSFLAGSRGEQGRASTVMGPPSRCPGDSAAPSPARTEECGTSSDAPRFTRIVIGVDPPAAGGTCGIIVCAKDSEGRAHVLADHSVTGRTPEGWSRAVADAARIWSMFPGEGAPRKVLLCGDPEGRGPGPAGARQPSPEQEQEPGMPRRVYPDRLQRSRRAPNEGKKRSPSIPLLIVAEQNQGGKMVEAILRTADPALKVRAVTATLSKAERAAPVAMLFEAGKVALHGKFPELEAELLGIIAGAPYEGPGTSPDRADAMVWALTELMLKPERVPRVRML